MFNRGLGDAIMNFMQATPALALVLFVAATGDEAWARGNGSHAHKGGHHRSPSRAVGYPYLYPPYGYKSTPAYSNRYKPSCATNPELEECVRERERNLFPQSGNASG